MLRKRILFITLWQNRCKGCLVIRLLGDRGPICIGRIHSELLQLLHYRYYEAVIIVMFANWKYHKKTDSSFGIDTQKCLKNSWKISDTKTYVDQCYICFADKPISHSTKKVSYRSGINIKIILATVKLAVLETIFWESQGTMLKLGNKCCHLETIFILIILRYLHALLNKIQVTAVEIVIVPTNSQAERWLLNLSN